MAAKTRLRSALDSPRGLLWAALVAVVLALPTLAVGELLDDHLVRAWALGDAPLWDAFHFVAPGELGELRERGMFGWWASESLALRFLRPLSALSHALDHALWPRAVWLMHLENVALYALCTALVGRLVTRVQGPGAAPGLAAMVFAIDAAHGATVGWISARNTMLALALGLVTLLCHARWRGSPLRAEESGDTQPGSWGWGALASACFIMTLLAGEGGLCCFGYVLAWACCLESGSWWRRALSLWPYLALILAWRLAYTQLGFGAHASGIYLDVGAEPHIFVWRALIYPLAMSGAQLTLPLVDLILGAPPLLYVLAAVFALILWAARPMFGEGDPRPRFWLFGMLFASVPLAATFPTARTLMLSGVGGAVLVALGWRRWRRGAGAELSKPRLPRVRGLVLAGVALAKLVLAPLLFVPIAFSSTIFEPPHRALAAELPEHTGLCVVLNPPAELTAFYPWAIAAAQGRDWPAHTYIMFAGMTPLDVLRVGERSLELESEAGWAALPIDRFTRDWREGVAVGERVELEAMTVEVLAVTADARPQRIRATFASNIDDVTIFGFGRDADDGSTLGRWAPDIAEAATFSASL